MKDSRPSKEVPSTVFDEIDAVCDRFEAAWQAALVGGPRPRIEDHLGEVPEALRLLLHCKIPWRPATFNGPCSTSSAGAPAGSPATPGTSSTGLLPTASISPRRRLPAKPPDAARVQIGPLPH